MEVVQFNLTEKIADMQAIANDLQISIINGLDDKLVELKEKYHADNIPSNLYDKESYDLVKSALSELKRPRIDIEAERKSIVKVPNTLVKKINASVKPFTTAFSALEEPWKLAKKAHDEEVLVAKLEAERMEEERISAIVTKIARIGSLPAAMAASCSADIMLEVGKLRQDNPDTWADEFTDKAKTAIDLALTALSSMAENAAIVEEAKLESERKAIEEKEAESARRKEEDERLAKQKAEQDAISAKLAAQQADIDRQKAEIAEAEEAKIRKDAEAKRLAEQATADKRIAEQEETEQKRIEAEKLENIETAINEASSDLNASCDIVGDIISGKIRHIGWLG